MRSWRYSLYILIPKYCCKENVYKIMVFVQKQLVQAFALKIEDYEYDSDLGEISLRRICSESMSFDIVD